MTTQLAYYLAAHWHVIEPALIPALFGVAVLFGRFWWDAVMEERT